MRMPLPRTTVVLLCQKCKHEFHGPCPDNGFGLLLDKTLEKPICPNCGSKKVIFHPCVHY